MNAKLMWNDWHLTTIVNKLVTGGLFIHALGEGPTPWGHSCYNRGF